MSDYHSRLEAEFVRQFKLPSIPVPQGPMTDAELDALMAQEEANEGVFSDGE